MSDTDTQLTIEEAVASAVNDALSPDKITEIVNKNIEKSIVSALDSSFAYGKTRDAIRSKLDEILLPVIEQMTIDDTNVKLDALLADIIQESAIGQRKELLRKFKLLVEEVPDYAVDLSVLFDAYCKWVAHDLDCDDREIDYDDEPSYMPIHVCCDIVTDKERSWSLFDNGFIEFTVRDEDDEIEEKFNRCVPIYRPHNESYVPDGEPRGCWTMMLDAITDFRAIRRLDPFTIELLRYQNARIKVHEDTAPGELEDWVEPDQTPQATWE